MATGLAVGNGGTRQPAASAAARERDAHQLGRPAHGPRRTHGAQATAPQHGAANSEPRTGDGRPQWAHESAGRRREGGSGGNQESGTGNTPQAVANYIALAAGARPSVVGIARGETASPSSNELRKAFGLA